MNIIGRLNQTNNVYEEFVRQEYSTKSEYFHLKIDS